MRVSGWGVVATGLVTAAWVTIFAVGRHMWEGRQASLDAARAERQRAVTEVAPVPPPTAAPLLGSEGRDPDGYPTRYVDRAALRSLLWHKRYADLTRYFEEFQSAFEADARREYWPSDAADAFGSAEPNLGPPLDAWVATTPASFAPYLARGSHWIRAGFARRGTDYAYKTAPEDFRAMEDALQRGLADLDRALELRPGLVAAMRLKLIAFRGDLARLRRTVDEAIAVCPSCFLVRAQYMVALVPRWGGSYEAMQEFAQERVDPANPKLRLLPGYILLDKADRLFAAEEPREALAVIQLATGFGEHWEFLYERAAAKDYLNDLDGALADLNRALELRPGHPRVLLKRAYIHHRAGRWEAAGRDLLAGIRMDPADDRARRIFDTIVGGLIYEGWTHHTAGRRADAVRVYDLAAELAPTNQEVQSRRGLVVIAGAAGAGDKIAALEEQARNFPDNLQVRQNLEYELAREGQFPRIVEMWTVYLATHPDDGAAYLSRGRAYFHMRRLEDAHADARRACELGNSEGCMRAKQVEAMIRH